MTDFIQPGRPLAGAGPSNNSYTIALSKFLNDFPSVVYRGKNILEREGRGQMGKGVILEDPIRTSFDRAR